MNTFRGCRMNFAFSLAVISIFISLAITEAAIVRKREISGFSNEKAKRPFCNAFTGCGKKRSTNSEALEAEAGVELSELARHVLAEARLWEQLQKKVDMMQALAKQMEDHQWERRKRSNDTPQIRQQGSSLQLSGDKDEQKWN